MREETKEYTKEEFERIRSEIRNLGFFDARLLGSESAAEPETNLEAYWNRYKELPDEEAERLLSLCGECAEAWPQVRMLYSGRRRSAGERLWNGALRLIRTDEETEGRTKQNLDSYLWTVQSLMFHSPDADPVGRRVHATAKIRDAVRKAPRIADAISEFACRLVEKAEETGVVGCWTGKRFLALGASLIGEDPERYAPLVRSGEYYKQAVGKAVAFCDGHFENGRIPDGLREGEKWKDLV